MLGEEVVEAVLDDFERAPIAHDLRETLRFLRDVTLKPGDATAPADVSPEALAEALHVCALFNLIDRLADAFGFAPSSTYLSREELLEHERRFFEHGYLG